MPSLTDPALDFMILVASGLQGPPSAQDDTMLTFCRNYFTNQPNSSSPEVRDPKYPIPIAYSVTQQNPYPTADSATGLLAYLARNTSLVNTAEALVRDYGANIWGYVTPIGGEEDEDPIPEGGYLVSITADHSKDGSVQVTTAESRPKPVRSFVPPIDPLEFWRTPLHAAAEGGNGVMCGRLIGLAAEVGVSNGRHANIWAAGCEYINKQDARGRTSLHYACRCGSVPATDAILGWGLRCNPNAEVEVPNECLLNVNAVDTEQGATPLHELAFQAKEGGDIIRRLVAGGLGYPPASTGIPDKQGYTALHWMSRFLYTSDLESLFFAFLEAAGREYTTADRAGVWSIAEGLGINAPNIHGVTPLHMAVMERNAQAIAALLKGAHLKCDRCSPGTQCPICCCKIDFVSIRGATPLHMATMDRSPSTEAIALLLEYGAFVSLKDSAGFTPLMCTYKYSRAVVVDDKGRTALNLLLDVGAI